MKNIKTPFKTLFLGLFLLTGGFLGQTKAQFNTRFALDVSAGAALPLKTGGTTDADKLPYIFPNFQVGTYASASLSYRFNRSFSAGLSFSQSLYYKWENPLGGETEYHNEFAFANFKPYFSVSTLGLRMRYDLLADSRLTPYINVGIFASNYSGELPPRIEIIDHDPEANFLDPEAETSQEYIFEILTVLRYNARVVSSTLRPGVSGGLGLSFAFSNYFSVYAESNYQHVFSADDNRLKTNLQILNTSFGLRMNVFKKRSLL